MSLRSKPIYNRLNRARLDAGALAIHKGEILDLFREVKSTHSAWIKGASPSGLAGASQRFMDLLSDVFLVPRKNLSLLDKPRPHGRDSKGRLSHELHGVCSSQGNIRIYLRTAAREQPAAFKTFFKTLVHEWVHHYDFEALRDTIHCAGFYSRIRSIYDCCIASEENPCQAENR